MKQQSLCLLLLLFLFPIFTLAQGVYSRRLNVNQGESINAIKGASDGGLYMLYTQNNQPGLCKTDPQGNILWAKLINSPATKLEIAPDGSVFTSSGTMLSKFTDTGVSVWAIGLSFNITDFDIASDGGIFCTGTTRVCKLDASGAVIWGRTLSVINHTTDIVASASGGAYITGNALSATSVYQRGTLIKISDLGTVDWTQQAQATHMNFRYVVETPDLQVSVAASEPGTFIATRVFRFNASGTLLWNNMVGPIRATDLIHDMTATSNNGIAIAGISSDGPNFFYKDPYVYWISSTGSSLAIFANMQYGSIGNPLPMSAAITTTSDGLLAYTYGEDAGPTASRKAWYGKVAATGSTCKPRTNGAFIWTSTTNAIAVSATAATITATPTTATATPSTLPETLLCSHCTTPATAAFTTTTSGPAATFTNTSTQALTYTWDFGDGNTSTAPNPVHTYTQAGTYTVCLTAIGGCDQDSACHTVTITNSIISGIILHPNHLSGIRSTTVKLTGTTTDSLISAVNGQYSFTVNTGGTYTITPSKNNDTVTNNGITTLDLVLIQRHILQQDTLDSPYKILAADVNNSASVSTLDIVLTRTVILQTATTFPLGRLWSMVDTSYVFPDTINPWPFPSDRSYPSATSLTNQDFYGIKLGDVNWSWNPTVAKYTPAGELTIDFGNLEARAGEEIEVPVKAENFEGIAGYQFTITWDPAILAYQSSEASATAAHFGTSHLEQGILTVSWNDEEGGQMTLPDAATLFNLKFKVIGTPETSTSLTANASIINAEAYNSNLDLLSIVTKPSTLTVLMDTESPTSTLQVHQTFPNPFTTSSTLRFTLTQPSAVRFTLTDLRGTTLMTTQHPYPAGMNEFHCPNQTPLGLPLAEGTYLLRLDAGPESRTIRMIHTNRQ